MNEMPSTKEVILSLKKVKEEEHLSIPDILKMLGEAGVSTAETTVRRIFARGSEDSDSFNFEFTIKPIAKVLLKNAEANDKAVQAQFDLYEQICLYKKEVIDSLRAQIEHMKEEQDTRCQVCGERTKILKDQVELKDRRMDEQAQRLDKLLARNEELTDQLLEQLRAKEA